MEYNNNIIKHNFSESTDIKNETDDYTIKTLVSTLITYNIL